MSSDGRRKCVLIIDDTALNRVQLKDILKDEVDVIEAENGDKGMEILRDRFHFMLMMYRTHTLILRRSLLYS